jgi:hypothetical protein
MNLFDPNSASALNNIRKVRISLQKQESAYIQKIHQEVLSQITKLMMSNDLTIEDIQTAVSSNSWKEKKAKREKIKISPVSHPITSSTVPPRINPIISKI